MAEKKTTHSDILLVLHYVELHPLLINQDRDELGLGCGKAPYFYVRGCRLEGGWEGGGGGYINNFISWSSIPGLERDTWVEKHFSVF